MYEHQDIIKKINMKIAGTLPSAAPVTAPAVAEQLPVPVAEAGEPVKAENAVTGKKRKNQKKKEKRKQKKLHANGGKDGDASSEDEKTEVPEQVEEVKKEEPVAVPVP